MNRAIPLTMALAILFVSVASLVARAEALDVDLSGYRADSGVTVQHRDGRLRVSWELERRRDLENRGHLVLDLRPGRPLIEAMGIAFGAPMVPLLENLDPVTDLLVGSRTGPCGPAAGDERLQRLLRHAGRPAVSVVPVEARPQARRCDQPGPPRPR